MKSNIVFIALGILILLILIPAYVYFMSQTTISMENIQTVSFQNNVWSEGETVTTCKVYTYSAQGTNNIFPTNMTPRTQGIGVSRTELGPGNCLDNDKAYIGRKTYTCIEATCLDFEGNVFSRGEEITQDVTCPGLVSCKNDLQLISVGHTDDAPLSSQNCITVGSSDTTSLTPCNSGDSRQYLRVLRYNTGSSAENTAGYHAKLYSPLTGKCLTKSTDGRLIQASCNGIVSDAAVWTFVPSLSFTTTEGDTTFYPRKIFFDTVNLSTDFQDRDSDNEFILAMTNLGNSAIATNSASDSVIFSNMSDGSIPGTRAISKIAFIPYTSSDIFTV